MSSAVAELDGILQSMLDLKAPGVNNSKITSITQLCNANVQVCRQSPASAFSADLLAVVNDLLTLCAKIV